MSEYTTEAISESVETNKVKTIALSNGETIELTDGLHIVELDNPSSTNETLYYERGSDGDLHASTSTNTPRSEIVRLSNGVFVQLRGDSPLLHGILHK